eukprot:1128954-Pelagomonas_calceolata.AAC.2
MSAVAEAGSCIPKTVMAANFVPGASDTWQQHVAAKVVAAGYSRGVSTDELHFSLLGSTGCLKSLAVALCANSRRKGR